MSRVDRRKAKSQLRKKRRCLGCGVGFRSWQRFGEYCRDCEPVERAAHFLREADFLERKQSFMDWYRVVSPIDKPWKGPSFEQA